MHTPAQGEAMRKTLLKRPRLHETLGSNAKRKLQLYVTHSSHRKLYILLDLVGSSFILAQAILRPIMHLTRHIAPLLEHTVGRHLYHAYHEHTVGRHLYHAYHEHTVGRHLATSWHVEAGSCVMCDTCRAW